MTCAAAAFPVFCKLCGACSSTCWRCRGPQEVLGEAFSYDSAWAQLTALDPGRKSGRRAPTVSQPAASMRSQQDQRKRECAEQLQDAADSWGLLHLEAGAPSGHAAAAAGPARTHEEWLPAEPGAAGSSTSSNQASLEPAADGSATSASSSADGESFAARLQLAVDQRLLRLPPQPVHAIPGAAQAGLQRPFEPAAGPSQQGGDTAGARPVLPRSASSEAVPAGVTGAPPQLVARADAGACWPSGQCHQQCCSERSAGHCGPRGQSSA